MSLEARKIRLIMELRQQGVSETEVLSAIERTPREEFVLESFHDQAYDNAALPIGHGQTISQPLVVGIMTQALEVNKRQKVLEIGTGSGYQAAVLSRLCRRLYTIERHKVLHDRAAAIFSRLRLHNITAVVGDGARGWPEQAPFERIMVTAAAKGMPEALMAQLAVGGIMVAPVEFPDDPFAQWVVKMVKTETGIITQKLMPVRFVPLVEGALPQE
ncbi:MAG: protein-L-isoaspartate O-methyltransferase [Alphaproteobacteria bacterium RIFOXYD12_FULL_60_8]|nr:MAG: protein-L-isoaspartate O-methyltransferase [Alphaproteobacteria bacterium RIFOXYD12_FULL_60_8]